MRKKGRKRTVNKKKKTIKQRIRRFILMCCFWTLLFLALTVSLFVYSVYLGLWGAIPDEEELRNIRHAEASALYTEEGVLLGKYYIENRTNVHLTNISSHAVHALIATEDVRFYQHEGVDKISMLRVIFKTLLLGDRSSGGGSTISQQLAKNLYPRTEQHVKFMPVIKLKEMFTAHRLEEIYSKDEILTLYLNTVSFGENTFGIESAAQQYFSTSAADLSLPRAATLIGMLKAPTYYNPRLHPQRAQNRRNTVLNQMVKYGFLSEDQGEKIKAEVLTLNYQPSNHYSGPAPYLREKIRQDALQILKEYNQKQNTNYNLYRDGLILVTTLDAELQDYAEKAMNRHMAGLQASFNSHLGKKEPWDNQPEILRQAITNTPIYKALKQQGLSKKEIEKILNEKKTMLIYKPGQGEVEVNYSSIDSVKHYMKLLHPAIIAADPRNGKIKVWVGGHSYKYFQYDQVEAARQVGSVFKPVVYSTAIQHGIDPNAYYANKQKTYRKYDNWTPRNSNNQYEGFYTLKGALSQSVNTIAVEVLLQCGIDSAIAQARQLGISSDLPPYPSLALGVANIPLSEMINPFLCFANQGKRIPTYYLKEIRDKKGNIIFKNETATSQIVLSENEAAIMNDMLSAVIDQGTGKRLRSNYGLQQNLAGKTGTTQNHVDGWFIGYHPQLVMGIRVGANDANIHFQSTRLGQGANMALPIFGEFMQACLKNRKFKHWQSLHFPMPQYEKSEKEIPLFKNELNWREKVQNNKLKKMKQEEEKIAPTTKPKKEGFLKRLFKGKRKEK